MQPQDEADGASMPWHVLICLQRRIPLSHSAPFSQTESALAEVGGEGKKEEEEEEGILVHSGVQTAC